MKYSIVLLWMVAVLLAAVNQPAARDLYTASFTEIGIGARQQAMGGAGGVLGGDPSAFFWNPAGVAFCKKRSVQLMHNWLFDGISSHDYAGGVVPLKSNAVLGFHMVRLGIDGIPVFPDLDSLGLTTEADINSYIQQTPAGALATGSFNYYDLAGVLTFSQLYERKLDLGWQYFVVPVEIPWGVNLKWLHSRMGTYGSANGIGLDAGFLVRFDGTKVITENNYLGTFSAGTAFQDITNTSLTWSNGRASNLYYNIKYSFGYQQPLHRLSSRITLAYDYNTKYNDSHWGAEYSYRDMAALRLGRDRGFFSAGLGLTWKGFTLDYAFNLGDFANAHRLCGGYVW